MQKQERVLKLSFQMTVPNQLEIKEETFTPTGPQHQFKGVDANNVFIYELEFGVTNTLGHHINSKENLMFLSIGIWHK